MLCTREDQIILREFKGMNQEALGPLRGQVE